MGNLKIRKTTRLYGADYDREGVFFLTICTKNKKCLLSRIVGTGVLDDPNKIVGTGVLDGPNKIVGTGVLDGPRVALLPFGQIAEKYLNQLSDFYDHVSVQSYVIMPNHIHLLLAVRPREDGPSGTPVPTGLSEAEKRVTDCGPSGTPVPTLQNSTVSRFVSTFKRFCNKECGENIWQYRSHDHVIRDREDHGKHLRYIAENPFHWRTDELFVAE